MDTTVVMDQKENESQENIETEGWIDVKGRKKTGKRANPSSNVETEETSAKKKKSCSGKTAV